MEGPRADSGRSHPALSISGAGARGRCRALTARGVTGQQRGPVYGAGQFSVRQSRLWEMGSEEQIGRVLRVVFDAGILGRARSYDRPASRPDKVRRGLSGEFVLWTSRRGRRCQRDDGTSLLSKKGGQKLKQFLQSNILPIAFEKNYDPGSNLQTLDEKAGPLTTQPI